MYRVTVAISILFVGFTADAFGQEPLFQSKVVSTATPGHVIDIDLDVSKSRQLFLVVLDGGDGISTDWADWAEPRIVVAGSEKRLTELKWTSANSGWGEPRMNRSAGDGPLRIGGQPVEYGIGTHATSVIGFDLPEGTTRFKARGGIDNGGSDQGTTSTVQFLVFSQPPREMTLKRISAANVEVRDPQNAVANLDVANGLEATLFASEMSGMLSPTDIDIDHLGRVWVCEVVNYRHRNGSRPEGDRILVVEDTDGDGASDKQTVFFQGREIDSALGICVLPTSTGKGTRVIVSCAPNVWVFTDEDGDLKADKKELLFANVGEPQHDHSTHAFVFGPDGKFYWNFGNYGRKVCDKNGKQIVDLLGREVTDRGQPYRQGMAFRCNMDGTEFEVLGHNFRNNYELTVDSFGTVWQSDNDDDGNKGVRINYVMEGGNFGYTDEITGASWQSPRTNIETEIPRRHWHLNDPGVVPNALQTGAGSPTGICIYEGSLLPAVFHNQIIHCDAGPNVVRAYPMKKTGAGYTGEMVNILVGTRDNWFRPSDVCVAPDGSLIVADWYDPGVGGHHMGDIDRGRLFRVAPPKSAYRCPKIDVSTIEGAIEGLKNPNLAVRYLAWTALHSFGIASPDQVSLALEKVFNTDLNPRFRARALGILGKIPSLRNAFLEKGVRDTNSDIRIAALRLAHQKLPSESTAENTAKLVSLLQSLVSDSSPEVRRECALMLRYVPEPQKSPLWAKLAIQHDGKDRWYLEALGIGATDDWDRCLMEAVKLAGTPSNAELAQSDAALDILWRSRSTLTPVFLASLLESNQATAAESPRFMRAFDFQAPGPAKEAALARLAFAEFEDKAKTEFLNAEAINRLPPLDLSKNPEQLATINRILNGVKGQQLFVTLVDKFNVTNRMPELLAIAQAKPDEQLSINAIRVLLAKKQLELLKVALTSKAGSEALATATALSNSGDSSVAELLLPIAKDEQQPLDMRREAIKGASRSKQGAAELLKIAESKQFDESLMPALSAALLGSAFDDVRTASSKLFPLPAGRDFRPLPSLGELEKLKGDSKNGKTLFSSIGKCNSCHVVNGDGKEVGPNLSEIGAKLSKQGIYESILFPSAGISHNYESWLIEFKNGTTQVGLIASEDAESISLKGADAIVRKFPIAEVENRIKQKVSLMPADIAKLLSQEEVTDLVEYLTTLKKAKKRD